MKILKLFSRAPTTAPVARERLQILLAHERNALSQSNLVAILREEVLAVIAKHVPIDPEKVQVKMESREAVSTLEIDIQVPTPGESAAAREENGEKSADASGKAA